MGIHQAKNCLEKKENIAQNSETVLQRGREFERKERRETNREKSGKRRDQTE